MFLLFMKELGNMTFTALKIARRNADASYDSLPAMLAAMQHERTSSRNINVSTRGIEAVCVSRDEIGIKSRSRDNIAKMTNHSFQQLCSRIGAPGGYLAKLPAELGTDLINYGLHHARDAEDMGILLTRDDTDITMRAATSATYGRIWNANVIDQIIDVVGSRYTPLFTKSRKGLTTSDRDMRIVLTDRNTAIEVPNRRDGKTGLMYVGITIGNSEVGAAALSQDIFLYDNFCENGMIFGKQSQHALRIRHTARANDRYMEEMRPRLQALMSAEVNPIARMLRAAQEQRVDNLDAFLAKRMQTKAQVTAVQAAFLADEGRPMTSLFDVTTGITAYARQFAHADERVAIERIGGDVLALAM